VSRVYPSEFVASFLRYRQLAGHMSIVPSAPAQAGAPMADVVVLVIGESASAQRWSLLGYQDHSTNAALAPWRDGLVALPVQTNGNITAQTVPLLLSYQQLESAPGGVLTYLDKATEAGFKVITLSNQTRATVGDNFFLSAFRQRSAQYLEQPADPRPWDDVLTPLMADVLHDTPYPEKLMLTMHTYGSHPEVKDRYPPAAELWPDAYDNSIAHTSGLLADWIAQLDRLSERRVVLIYISDHGLTFPACGGSYTHGFTRSAYEVPLLLWGNARFREHNADWWGQWQARARQAVAADGRLQFTNLLVPFALDDLLGMSQASKLPAPPIATAALTSDTLYPPPADARQCEHFTPYDVGQTLSQMLRQGQSTQDVE
jgi:glucan phosphoethanolaminetransferase (alkaline phosphatase superfamily)